jgi:hypothetical protein
VIFRVFPEFLKFDVLTPDHKKYSIETKNEEKRVSISTQKFLLKNFNETLHKKASTAKECGDIFYDIVIVNIFKCDKEKYFVKYLILVHKFDFKIIIIF